MKNYQNFKKEILKDKKIKKEYDDLSPRYQLISDLIRIRLKKGMSQKELAEKIGTKQSAIARLEAGRENISMDSLEKVCHALDAKLKICIS